MTFRYSHRSLTQRQTLAPVLAVILDDVLVHHDFAIIQGARTPGEQEEAFRAGFSRQSGFLPDGTPSDYPHRVHPDGFCYAVDLHPVLGGKKVPADDFEDVEAVREMLLVRGYGTRSDLPQDLSGLSMDIMNLGHRMAQFAYFLGVLKEAARPILEAHALHSKRYRLRMGIDWDRDGTILTDQRFNDWFHVELEEIQT